MIFKLVSYLPLSVLYLISDVMYVGAFYLVRYRYGVVRENVVKAFPEKEAGEQHKIIRSFYRNLCDFTMESLKGMTLSSKEINKRVTLHQKESVERYFSNGQSVIILTTHQFNWEWLLFASCLQLSAPLNPIYKKLNNRYYDRLMLKTRSRFGAKPIEMQDTLAEIMKRKSAVNGFGLVADQIPLATAEKYWTQFLGRETAFFVGPEKIAQMTKYPVIFAGMRKVKRGYYQVYFKALAEAPYDKSKHQILDSYIVEAEKILREQPESWLWSHRRWKYEKPFYDD